MRYESPLAIRRAESEAAPAPVSVKPVWRGTPERLRHPGIGWEQRTTLLCLDLAPGLFGEDGSKALPTMHCLNKALVSLTLAVAQTPKPPALNNSHCFCNGSGYVLTVIWPFLLKVYK